MSGTPLVSVGDAQVGESGLLTTFAVTLSEPSSDIVLVNFGTQNDTAGSADFVGTSGTLLFLPGETSKSIGVVILPDLIDEADESFSVTLSDPTNATLGDSVGVGTILDDDPLPTLVINDVSVTEGGMAVFSVSLSAASGRSLSVNYATANGTALAGSDYTSTSGTLTFTPGQTVRTLAVAAIDDTLSETSETFSLLLTSPVNVVISDGTGVGTIIDNDSLSALSITGTSVTEGGNAVLTVSLSAASGQTVTVGYATANGTATSPDYTGSSGTLVFAPGEMTKNITLATTDDTLDENDETFSVSLNNPNGATISGGTAQVTIVDNDPLPSLSISDSSVGEGGSDVFTVSLSAVSGRQVTVNYTTVTGTATSKDFAGKSGSLTFAPGEASKTISVSTAQDTLDEDDEVFSINLSGPTNATLNDSTGVGTIVDDDAMPTLTISSASASEGSSATFLISLSAVSGRNVTVNYGTANGTAKGDGDYIDFTAASGSLTFTPGQVGKIVTISTRTDTYGEQSEWFNVVLSGAVNATFYQSVGIGTIFDTAVNEAPLIVQFCGFTEAGEWIFTGLVFDEGSNALTIVFGGILDGYSVTTEADGSFTLFVQSLSSAGTATAQTVDSSGLASNVASFDIYSV